jgi:hypothetical protein
MEGFYDGESSFGAVMICSTTMVAFGPVFDTEQECELFIKWFESQRLGSVRRASVDTLRDYYAKFRTLIAECECGELKFVGKECSLCGGENDEKA